MNSDTAHERLVLRDLFDAALAQTGLDGSFRVSEPHIRERIRWDSAGGIPTIRVLTRDGEDLLVDDGRPATMRDLLEDLAADPQLRGLLRRF